jgi:hypothetical protein
MDLNGRKLKQSHGTGQSLQKTEMDGPQRGGGGSTPPVTRY